MAGRWRIGRAVARSRADGAVPTPAARFSSSTGRSLLGASDAEQLTVYAAHAIGQAALLTAVSPFCVGDLFCATDPGDDAQGYSATISDTLATFVIDATQDPLFGALPAALAGSGWDARDLTAYRFAVAAHGPGGQRLRYRLAKCLLELSDGLLVTADGTRTAVEELSDATWGSLW